MSIKFVDQRLPVAGDLYIPSDQFVSPRYEVRLLDNYTKCVLLHYVVKCIIGCTLIHSFAR
jgi:hypothetical protein